MIPVSLLLVIAVGASPTIAEARANTTLATRDAAASKPAKKPPLFTGATVGISAFTGPTLLSDERAQGRWGFAGGVSGRVTSALFIGDIQFGYGVSRVSATSGVEPFSLTRQSLFLTVALHPLFIVTLGNKWIHYVLGAMHLDIGASFELSSLSVGGDRRSRGNAAWHWGFGADLPVTDPNRGRSVWIGLRFRQVRFSADLAPAVISELGDTQFLVTFEYRWNWK